MDIEVAIEDRTREYTSSPVPALSFGAMRVLALDTTTIRGSVALLEDGEVRGEVRMTTADGHSGWLLPAIEEIRQQAGRVDLALDGLAVTTGPGSFTGQRVGLATVQGLALGLGRPCVGVSALDVHASLAGEDGPVIALMDAWRDEVYAGAYEGGRPLGPPRVEPLEHLLAWAPPHAVFVGDGAQKFRDRIALLWPEGRVVATDLFLAAALGRLAGEALQQGRGTPPESLRPLYLRGAVDRAKVR